MNFPPSIFNDVLGPVMKGPSSSHCAAAHRIGTLCHDLMNAEITHLEVTYNINGSLATTHKSQGSDMGLYAGILGWEIIDDRLPDSEKALRSFGIKLELKVEKTQAIHPNTYELLLKNDEVIRSVKAISTGGGMIEIIEIDDKPISIKGDFYELLISLKKDEILDFEDLKNIFKNDLICIDDHFFHVKSSLDFTQALIDEVTEISGVDSVIKLKPVLPVISVKGVEVPFTNCGEMLDFVKDRNEIKLWELAVIYELQRAQIDESELMDKMRNLVRIMKASINTGLAGTEYKDRILGAQSLSFKNKMAESALLDGGMLNQMILYVSAIMETKSSMGLIVAAPTAGSCGCIPGSLIAASESLNSSEEDLLRSMFAAGLIGVFISKQASFSAEVAGCQAECGAASAMAAAGLVSLANGSLEQSITAASLALQNSLGMICDPIANRVEAPCLGKNIMAASNALSCANMALANYNPLVSFDEVVKTMLEVGKSLPNELRCTALGGLSITESSKKIEKQLKKKA
jgi:L-serine dehydratase